MRTIVFASQKGGSGKTTLCRNLAVAAVQAGHRVVLADLDPQQSLRAWWQAREADAPELVEGGLERLAASPGDGLLLIDTAPAAGAALRPVLGLATLAVVPVQPSPDDLRAVGATVAELERAKVPFAFVLNRAPRANVTNEAARVLAGRGRVAPVNIAQRVAHLEAAASGMGVTELRDAKAAEEINQLWRYLEGLI